MQQRWISRPKSAATKASSAATAASQPTAAAESVQTAVSVKHQPVASKVEAQPGQWHEQVLARSGGTVWHEDVVGAPGWQIAQDPTTGNCYFFNNNSGLVQWDPPAFRERPEPALQRGPEAGEDNEWEGSRTAQLLQGGSYHPAGLVQAWNKADESRIATKPRRQQQKAATTNEPKPACSESDAEIGVWFREQKEQERQKKQQSKLSRTPSNSWSSLPPGDSSSQSEPKISESDAEIAGWFRWKHGQGTAKNYAATASLKKKGGAVAAATGWLSRQSHKLVKDDCRSKCLGKDKCLDGDTALTKKNGSFKDKLKEKLLHRATSPPTIRGKHATNSKRQDARDAYAKAASTQRVALEPEYRPQQFGFGPPP